MKRLPKSTLIRLGWLSLAMLFLVSGVILTAVIGYQATHQNNSANKASQTANNLTCRSDPSIKVNQPAAGSFSDTKLASFAPSSKISQLGCIDITVGSGAIAQADSTVSVNYVGALAKDGTIFESSYKSGQPISFSLTQVIPGWSLGLPGMKVGGVRRLLIPAAQAYGSQSPSAAIPANSDLVFDISLISVN